MVIASYGCVCLAYTVAFNSHCVMFLTVVHLNTIPFYTIST